MLYNFIIYHEYFMNNTINYTTFSNLLPEIFAQIIEGDNERTYRSDQGSITIKLIDDQGDYLPKISHYGSWQHKDLCDKVRAFFKQVSFSTFYKLQDREEKELLKGVFQQILLGTNEQKHSYGDTDVFDIFLKKSGDGLVVTINKNNKTSNQNVVARIKELIAIQSLQNYFKLNPNI